MFEIVEKFVTLSGEAPITGHPVYLIRFSGCNLDCSYCDTPYKNEVNFTCTKDQLIADINNQLKISNSLFVLLTGGEPLMPSRYEKIIYVIKKLKKIDFYIETNGSVLIKKQHLKNCHYVMDWKSLSSGETKSFCMENLKRLNKKDCLKIVVSSNDLEWFKNTIDTIKNINKKIPIYVSPQYGSINLEILSDYIIKNNLPVTLSLQIHKIIWKNRERGV
jgi:7-carboxy-7-deazaguanine synthase